MSGLINSAGSKSGVIGQTELEYEEGDWTPTADTGWASGTIYTSHYIKIGNIVTIWVYMDYGNSSTAVKVGNLPFDVDFPGYNAAAFSLGHQSGATYNWTRTETTKLAWTYSATHGGIPATFATCTYQTAGG